jgi:hypothetical protein
MSKRPKFNPEINRVKLNPEQAVLQCQGYKYGMWDGTHEMGTTDFMCVWNPPTKYMYESLYWEVVGSPSS